MKHFVEEGFVSLTLRGESEVKQETVAVEIAYSSKLGELNSNPHNVM